MEDAYARRILQMMRSDLPESDDPGGFSRYYHTSTCSPYLTLGEILMMRNVATSRLNTSPVFGESGSISKLVLEKDSC